jgi:hypothetical protein
MIGLTPKRFTNRADKNPEIIRNTAPIGRNARPAEKAE